MSAFDFHKLTPGEAFEFRRVAGALVERQYESLKLYRPMPRQQLFHDSTARERIIRGGNRAGKTAAAAAEVARIVTGNDPMGRLPKAGGICYCVGFDGRHIGQTMWKKLGKPGAFKIIRDAYTKQFRAYMPWLPEDIKRSGDAKPAPALIPGRMIKEIAWELKKEQQPKIVYLVNGWELHFFSGNAKPPMGVEIDLAWFDEEIPSGEWYAEIAARLVDRRGYFLWSATPQAGTDRLYDLHERAEMEAEMNVYPRTVEEIVIHIDDNIHMTDAQRAEFKSKLSEDDKDVRIEGDFSRIHKVYPEYSSKVHEIPYREIPENWTRYVAIDPGRQRGAGLFLAVSPPTGIDANLAVLYDEIYVKDCDAFQFGEAMRIKCVNQEFRAFIIDNHEARKYDTGSGIGIGQQYSDQLKRVGVTSYLSGNGFLNGDDNLKAGIEAVRMMLRSKHDGLKLRVMAERVPNFLHEVKRYRYKRVAGNVVDEPVKKNDHLCFAAGTLIETSLGDRPIEDVLPGDQVLTRKGFCEVTDAMMTCAEAEVYRVSFSDGRSLVATGNHPIFVDGKGFVPVDCLRYSDKVSLSINYRENLCDREEITESQKSSFLTDSSIGVIRNRKTGRCEFISQGVGAFIFTEKFGNLFMGKFQKDTTFITKMKTLLTTRSRIWNVFRREIILGIIDLGRFLPRNKQNIWSVFGQWLLSGIEAMKAAHGTASIPLMRLLGESQSSTNASNAERNSSPRKLEEFDFATSIASQPLASDQVLITLKGNVCSVARNSSSISTSKRMCVHPVVVGVERLSRKIPVFNLTVEGEHEYFANGVLVSNCDALRYLCAYQPKWYPPPKPKSLISPAYQRLLRKREKQKAENGESSIMWGPR